MVVRLVRGKEEMLQNRNKQKKNRIGKTTWRFVLYTSVFKLFDKAISCFNEWSMLHTNGIY